MLLCPTCNTAVLVTTDSVLAPMSGCNVTPNGISVQVVDLVQIAAKGPAGYYCPSCGVRVEPERLVVRCSHCSEIVPVEQACIPQGGGSMYCKSHGKLLFNRVTEIPINMLFIK